MSINFEIQARREILVLKTNKVTTQWDFCPAWFKTGTEVTKMILDSKEPFETYCAWIVSQSSDRDEPVYDKLDFFHEDEPISIKTVNDGKEVVAAFKEWIREKEKEGWEILYIGI